MSALQGILMWGTVQTTLVLSADWTLSEVVPWQKGWESIIAGYSLLQLIFDAHNILRHVFPFSITKTQWLQSNYIRLGSSVLNGSTIMDYSSTNQCRVFHVHEISELYALWTRNSSRLLVKSNVPSLFKKKPWQLQLPCYKLANETDRQTDRDSRTESWVAEYSVWWLQQPLKRT